ncbi:MAG: pyridoxal phosphate-dependent aminotransferase [Pseudomonadota bacterium]
MTDPIMQSSALQRIAPSPTIAATQKARMLKARGADIISLTAGEPDFDTPTNIKDAAIEAIKRGETKYTPIDGIPDLKEAIAKKFARDNDLQYASNEITVAPGGKAVIFSAFLGTLNPGDEVIIPAPYWVSYPDIVKLTGATPIIIPTKKKDEFLLTPDALAAAISPRTRWIILNNPGNPTGSMYSREWLEALGDILLEHQQIMILTDDIYEKIVYGSVNFSTIAQVQPKLFRRTLTMNGASKCFAMTGWRIGYAGGPQSVIKAMTKVMSQSTTNACSISQWACVEALNGNQAFLDDWTVAFRGRRDVAVSIINDTPGLTCATPKGAFYVFAHCAGVINKTSPRGRVIKSDVDFTDALMEEAGVGVVSGAAFGMSPYFRLSYAAADEDVENACLRIKNFCTSLT